MEELISLLHCSTPLTAMWDLAASFLSSSCMMLCMWVSMIFGIALLKILAPRSPTGRPP